MEAFGIYLLKSMVWLTGFALIYFIFLRNERFFSLNRAFLLAGILASIVLPFYTWHYAVILPSQPVEETFIPEVMDQVNYTVPVSSSISFYWWFYIFGTACLLFRMIIQILKLIFRVWKTGYEKNGPLKLVRTPEYNASFSFFSYVFVNPSISDTEMQEILNHESGHIQSRHWFDLLLIELLKIVQWFNPFVWIYAHLIRQNHEYLADESALRHTSDPAIYRAALLNQVLGVTVISLANSFSYSLNQKRFKMTKKRIQSPIRKLKLLFVLPFITAVFYGFAKPEYIVADTKTNENSANLATITAGKESMSFKTETSMSTSGGSNMITGTSSGGTLIGTVTNTKGQQQSVKGRVITSDGKPLSGSAVLIEGTTTGTITDSDGNFILSNVPENTMIVVSCRGYNLTRLLPDYSKKMEIKMQVNGPDGMINNASGTYTNQLILVDGQIISKDEFAKLDVNRISSVSVLRGEDALKPFGEKGKNGVILITTKDGLSSRNDSVLQSGKGNVKTGYGKQNVEPVHSYNEVEVKPQFPGGESNLYRFLAGNMKYPVTASEGGITGTLLVRFVVSKTGQIDGVNVMNEADPALRQQAVSVLRRMPAWEPGKVKGEAVDVACTIPMKFMLTGVKSNDQVDLKGDFGQVSITGFGPQTQNTPPPPPPVQDKNLSTLDGKQVYKEVEQMPEYPGGQAEMIRFIQENMKYPTEASTTGIQGTVIVQFVVSKVGKIQNIKIVRGIGSGCDEEAVRVLKAMPDWTPGKKDGKEANVYYILPFRFLLNNGPNQKVP